MWWYEFYSVERALGMGKSVIDRTMLSFAFTDASQ